MTLCVAMITMASLPAWSDARRHSFSMDEAGMAVISVEAFTPEYEWSMPHPAPVLDVMVDGRLAGNIVVFGGMAPFLYQVLSDRIEAGDHNVTVGISGVSRSMGTVEIATVTVEPVYAGDSRYQAYSHSPVMYGHDYNDISDTPLLLWAEVARHEQASADYAYSFVWTNEDGGTPTAALFARYGRTIDCELAIAVSTSPDGSMAREIFQTYKHKFLPFDGSHSGSRPILYNATVNNVFDTRGNGKFRFSPVPDIIAPLGDDVREIVLDANPWIYRIMAQELVKEDKILSSGAPLTDIRKGYDPRDYVYVDVNLKFPALPSGETIVRLKGDPMLRRSSGGNPDVAIDGSGWTRSAVFAGRRPSLADIEAVGAALIDENSNNTITVLGIKRVTVLDESYRPVSITIDHKIKTTVNRKSPRWLFSLDGMLSE